jgi:hypothetical protein
MHQATTTPHVEEQIIMLVQLFIHLSITRWMPVRCNGNISSG